MGNRKEINLFYSKSKIEGILDVILKYLSSLLIPNNGYFVRHIPFQVIAPDLSRFIHCYVIMEIIRR
jgi:hypothetical protein